MSFHIHPIRFQIRLLLSKTLSVLRFLTTKLLKNFLSHRRDQKIGLSTSKTYLLYLLLLPGASRDRTDDPLLAKQMLSQLSYGPNSFLFLPIMLRRHPFISMPSRSTQFVGLGGLEPPTPRLSSVCSNQLSYRPFTELRALRPLLRAS